MYKRAFHAITTVGDVTPLTAHFTRLFYVCPMNITLIPFDSILCIILFNLLQWIDTLNTTYLLYI